MVIIINYALQSHKKTPHTKIAQQKFVSTPSQHLSLAPSSFNIHSIIPYLRSTQPCIPLGSLNRVPASAGVRAGRSPLPGGR